LKDSKIVSSGKEIFIAKCVACHGQAGEGGVGPNLTDEYWLHGGSINDIFKTVKYGVPEKGMIAWQATLKPNEIQSVSNYILSIQGSNPANAKAPQGEKATAGVDSTSAKPVANL
jgi:cytochrome c oxidase cbb3-type subunit 3